MFRGVVVVVVLLVGGDGRGTAFGTGEHLGDVCCRAVLQDDVPERECDLHRGVAASQFHRTRHATALSRGNVNEFADRFLLVLALIV